MKQGFTIVFNGEHTLRQCITHALKALDRMVIVEGATEQMKPWANDGRSTDSTNDILDDLLAEFKDRVIVLRKNGGYWDKIEMCDLALSACQMGPLWQIDCDEFYDTEAMRRMTEFAHANPAITDFEFWGRHFYGGFHHHTRMLAEEWGNTPPWRRLFRYDGLPWITHAPPRLKRCGPDVVMERDATRSGFGIELFHYGYVWRSQVIEKSIYHNVPVELQRWDRFVSTGVWWDDGKIHKIERYDGPHPVDVGSFV